MWIVLLLLPVVLHGHQSCDPEIQYCDAIREEPVEIEPDQDDIEKQASLAREMLANEPQQVLPIIVYQIFQVVDENSDQVLDMDETEVFGQQFQLMTDKSLGVIDHDGDGYVTLMELQQSLDQLLANWNVKKLESEDGERIINRDGTVIRW